MIRARLPELHSDLEPRQRLAVWIMFFATLALFVAGYALLATSLPASALIKHPIERTIR
jgi:type VI protein secretion system component VasF